jgi:hypothetical protein
MLFAISFAKCGLEKIKRCHSYIWSIEQGEAASMLLRFEAPTIVVVVIRMRFGVSQQEGG